MKRLMRTLCLTLALSCITSARNAADLKADLARIAPAGEKIRLAWIKGGPYTEFPFYASKTAVYVVDSDDGVIRRLWPLADTGNYSQVDITADGSKVLFWDKSSGKLCVINWDGSGFRTVNISGKIAEYWRNPADNTDWTIEVEGGTAYRIRIDQPASKVKLGDNQTDNGGGGLSDDGTKWVNFCYGTCAGAIEVWNTTTFQPVAGTHGGCWSSMSAGPTPKYNHNPSGHQQMCVHDVADQSKFTVYEVAKRITDSLTKSKQTLPAGPANGCGEWTTTEGNRFTQHPEFATLMYAQSSVNPILMHLSDMKFVYIMDGLSCGFCGDMDAVFLGPSSARTTPGLAREAGLDRGNVGEETYFPDGRRLGQSVRKDGARAGVKGILIRHVKGSGGRLITEID